MRKRYKEMNLLEFQDTFFDEEACWKYLFKQRWPNGFRCPRCKSHEGGWHAKRELYQCKSCRYQVSVTAGTLFEKTRTPLRKWFWMIYILSSDKHSMSMLEMQRMLKIGNYQTVWTMAHKIRKAMSDRDQRYKLKGIVGVDESYFGGKNKKGKRGRGASGKTPVFVAVEEREGGARFAAMQHIADTSGKSLKGALEETVESGAAIKSDGWRGYNGVEKEGYDHNHDAPKGLHWVHIVISNTKRFILGTHHGVSFKHLHRYIAEFCYRFNRRFWHGQLFDRLMTACVRCATITYAEVIG